MAKISDNQTRLEKVGSRLKKEALVKYLDSEWQLESYDAVPIVSYIQSSPERGPATPPDTFYIDLEDSGYILLEDSFALELEEAV